MFEALFKDLRHTLRMFRQSRAFAFAAIAALTHGIGANTAIFSVVNAVLLRPVAFPDPDRLVLFLTTSPNNPGGTGASPASSSTGAGRTPSCRTSPPFVPASSTTSGTFPEQLRSGQVSADFFKLFGAPIIRGRTFSAEEDLPDAPRVVVLGQRFWESRFNRAADAIGKTISLSGEPYTIIGVLGEFEFEDFGPTPQVWVPFQLPPNTADQGHYFGAAGRIKPGVSLQQAQQRLLASADDARAGNARMVLARTAASPSSQSARCWCATCGSRCSS